MSLSEPNPSPEVPQGSTPPSDHLSGQYAARPQGTPKYEARVVEIGAMVPEMLEAGILIFFGEQAPSELREIAIVHDGTTLATPLAAGDVLVLGDMHYRVTAVGAMASDNFAQLGHIVVKANGATETDLPGEVSVENVPLRVPEPGAVLWILETLQEEPGAETHVEASVELSHTEAQPGTQPTPQRRKSLWAFLNAWRSSK